MVEQTKMAAPLDKLFVRNFDRNDGSTLKINQSEIGDVGCVVWDAAIVLSCYLDSADFANNKTSTGNKLEGQHVLELGSGTGLVGLQAACLGAEAVITDLDEFVPLMKLNIAANAALTGGRVKAQQLEWGETQTYPSAPHFDLILLADCIYYDKSLKPLVDTMVALCGEDTTVFCCYEERTTGNKPQLEQAFFEMVRQSFLVEEVPLEKQDPVYRSADIHIMKFTPQMTPS